MNTSQSPSASAASAESRIAQVASLGGWIVAVIALTLLAGWAFHVTALISIGPGLSVTKVNTALAFLLAGLALIRRQHRDCFVYSLGVLAIGAATLIEYLSASDLGIDQWLFRDPYNYVGPGRMSQITSAGCILLGLTLALMNARSETGRRMSRGFGIATGLLGVVALLGYTYDTQALYRVRPYTTVALPTAIAFVIAAIAAQCVNPGEGVVRQIRADTAGGAMLRRLLLAALLIPYLLGLMVWLAHKHFNWEMGFSLAFMVAGTVACLVIVMFLNAQKLEQGDLERRQTNRFLVELMTSLQAHQELLKMFVKHVPVPVAMFDRDMRYLQISDRWCSDYSLDGSQLLGRSHYAVFPDLPERWKQNHQRSLAGETLRSEEDRWDRSEGNTIWLRWEIRPWGRRNGLPEGIIIFSENITERKLGEEMLRESEATTRSLFEAAAQAILAVDVRGVIVWANRMAAEMFGYQQSELLGTSIDGLLPGRLRQQHSTHRAEFASNPRTRPMGIGMDLQGLRKHGSEFPIEVSLSHVPSRRGPLAVSFVSDITERKRAEELLRNSEQQLRGLAGSLLSAQEDERRRLSRELHDDVTQRLAFLSIELGKLAEDVPDSLGQAQATIRTLQDQTLQASVEVRRLSHGLHPSVIEDFGLSVALEEFCGEFAKAQGINVNFEKLADDSRLDEACAASLYRITQESLRNAVTHGRATEICVTLSADCGSMQLRVTDNGAGFLVDGVRTKPGLGMASMRERIRLVNGTLTLSSQPGHGTEIIASAPIVRVAHE